MKVRRPRPEDGFTLVELIITIMITTLITGAMSTAFITALHGSQSTGQRIRESNDAQIIATYLTRDAQAAGGTNPSTNTPDSSLGVSLTDAAGCTSATGSLVVRFKWIDWSSATSGTTRVASYWYDSSAGELLRQTCSTTDGTTKTDSFTLGTHIGSSPAAPTASCVPAADCPGTPDEVRLTISELNNPPNAPTPYTYTLSASVRPQAGTAPTAGNSSTVAFLLLGGSSCEAGGSSDMSSSGGGSSTIRVYGPAFLSGYDPNCPAATMQGSPDFEASGGTFSVGSCSGVSGGCQTGSSIPDPFANLPYPSGTTSTGACPSGLGANPGPDASGNYSPGTYRDLLTISGTKNLKSGTYVFCKGLTLNGTLTSAANGVLLYFAGGTLTDSSDSIAVTAQTSGTYAGLALWQRAADTVSMQICCNNGLSAWFGGTVYVPGAVVTLHNGTIYMQALVALGVIWTGGGNGGTTIGTVPPAVKITGPGSLTSPWTQGQSYPSATMSATGGAGADTWSATGLPPGLTIDAASGVISGTPTASNTYSVTVKVTDAFGGTDTQPYTVKINATPSVSAPSSLPSWTVNRAYPSTTVTVSGGTSPFAWAATNLPSGLSMNSSTGVISGTPTATGSFAPKVTVTDTTGATASRNYSMTINSAPSITTSSLPNASQGVAYSTTVNGTGGTTAYGWSATGLPAGLTINAGTGVISGTPTGSGTSTANITLTDAAGATTTRSLGLTVNVVTPMVTNVALGNANGQVASGDTITVTFNKAIAVSSICAGWSGNTTDQSLNANNDVVVHLNDNAGATGNDTVTVTSTACPTLHFGTLDLGSPNVVTSTRTFSGNGGNKGSVNYTASSFVLTVTLGSGTAGTSGVSAQTVTYTPSPSVTDTFGNAISGSYPFASRRF